MELDDLIDAEVDNLLVKEFQNITEALKYKLEIISHINGITSKVLTAEDSDILCFLRRDLYFQHQYIKAKLESLIKINGAHTDSYQQ